MVLHSTEDKEARGGGMSVAMELGHGNGVCAAQDRGTERERGEREMKASARLLHSTRQHAGVVMGDDGAWSPRGREVGCQFGHG
jgi:hypothetical protein